VTSFVAETAEKRLAGERPSRTRAFLVASMAAVGAGALIYRVLRSTRGTDETSSSDE